MSQEERYKEIILVDDIEQSSRVGTLEDLVEQEKKELAKKPSKMALKVSVDDVIKVSKFVWDIIKDSKASAATESTTSRILSAKDGNWENYELAKNFESKEVTYKLNNFVGVNC